MTDSESSQSNGSEFEVEAIENDRITEYKDPKTRRTKNIREYLIKWVGYRRRSWEPEENLENCLQMLEQYKKNKKKLNKGIVKNNKNNSNTNTNNKNTSKNNTNTIPNTKLSRTPMKFVVNKANRRNLRPRDTKTKENNSKSDFCKSNVINNDINNKNYKTNNKPFNPYYSDEEDDKFSPANHYNSLLFPHLSNTENNSQTSGDSGKNETEKKLKKNEMNSLGDYDIDIENWLNKEANNNENNNNINNIIVNNNSFFDRLERIKEKGKEKEQNSLKINLLKRKRKLILPDDSDNSSISISIDDPFFKMEKESYSFNNTNEFTNTNNNNDNNSNKKENIEILEVKIPDIKTDQIILVCKNKESDYIFQSTSKNMVIPQNVLIDCYERIFKNYLNGKTIKIS